MSILLNNILSWMPQARMTPSFENVSADNAMSTHSVCASSISSMPETAGYYSDIYECLPDKKIQRAYKYDLAVTKQINRIFLEDPSNGDALYTVFNSAAFKFSYKNENKCQRIVDYLLSGKLRPGYDYAKAVRLCYKLEVTMQDIVDVKLCEKEDGMEEGWMMPLNKNISSVKKFLIQGNLAQLLSQNFNRAPKIKYFMQIPDKYIVMGLVNTYKQSIDIKLAPWDQEAAKKAMDNMIKSNMFIYTNIHHIHPISWAVSRGDIQLVRTWINAGMSIDNDRGFGGLHLAAQLSSTDILQYLLQPQHGANKNAQDVLGFTPLHIAVLARQYAVVHMLIKYNVDIALPNKIHYNALHYAVQEDCAHRDIIKCLFSELNISGKWNLLTLENDDGDTALHKAAEINGIMDCLFEHCGKEALIALLHTLDRDGKSLIHKDIENGRATIIKLLFKYAYGDRIIDLLQILDREGNSPLHLAMKKGDMPIIEYIFKKVYGATILEIFEILDKNGDSLLHASIKKGSIKIIELLLKKFNPETTLEFLRMRNRKGDSSLDIVIKTKQSAILKFLFKNLHQKELIRFLKPLNYTDAALHVSRSMA